MAIRFKYETPSRKPVNAIILRSSETLLETVQFDGYTADNTFKNKLNLQSVIDGSLKIEILK